MKNSNAVSSKSSNSQRNNTIVAPTSSSSTMPTTSRDLSNDSSNGYGTVGADVNVQSSAEEEEMRMLREQSNKISVRLVLERLKFCLIAFY